MDRIEKIQQHKEAVKKQKEMKDMVKEATLKDRVAKIKNLKPRIDKLIELANACLENDIDINKCCSSGWCRGYDNYQDGTFVTNGISHHLGFLPPLDNIIYEIGIIAGGCCGPWDLHTNGTYVTFVNQENDDERDSEEKDISTLEKLLNDFEKFETAFYKYVDQIIEDGVEPTHYFAIKIHYSWGDEEPIIPCPNVEIAWEKAKQLALKEAETASMENDCEIGLSFDNLHITLRYMHDNTYCFYDVVNFDQEQE